MGRAPLGLLSPSARCSQTSRLAALTQVIATETRKIEQYFAANALPVLSFDAGAPLDFPVPASNVEIQRARRAVVNATQELHDLMVGPRESIRWMGWSYNDNLSLHAVYHFDIAQAVPLDAEISYDDLAARTGVDRVNLKRLVRHAMTNRVFCEPRDGYVAHTAASRVLIEDEMMNDWVGMCSAEFFPAAARTVDAMVKWPASQEPTQCGYSVGWNIDVPMFVEIGKSPARAKRFGRSMASLTGGEGYEVDHLVTGYPWADLGEATVVDLDKVGGSHGFVPVALAKRFPKLRFVVQDLPKTVADGPSHIPPELSDRIEFQAHDFYQEQPVKDADVYFFRWIMHNQSDKYAEKMLRCLIPALKPGARIVINENILPKPGTEDPWDEKIIRTMDVTMLQLLNARERAEEDYAELFQRTDPRFKFVGVVRPEGSRTCTIEAIWQPSLHSALEESDAFVHINGTDGSTESNETNGTSVTAPAIHNGISNAVAANGSVGDDAIMELGETADTRSKQNIANRDGGVDATMARDATAGASQPVKTD
ncbi:S-adenosyl-L-methionine-dependent methyltransferase [Saccharata proteae CBS 121410]|uniref:S-adenosyl-L-methionine-dependent methyltransferase n=1 Tax=Saccharata proteae CBS 121410 TaxID=1314787 RepID=A0A9P4HY04_9PEZI|nr:S-adenosyl-L-methionine-dependent methyltransferase [Saccharata proteae CBS 121410]